MPGHTETLRGLSFQKNVIPGAVTVTAASALGLGQYSMMLAGASPILREVAMGEDWQTAADRSQNQRRDYFTVQQLMLPPPRLVRLARAERHGAAPRVLDHPRLLGRPADHALDHAGDEPGLGQRGAARRERLLPRAKHRTTTGTTTSSRHRSGCILPWHAPRARPRRGPGRPGPRRSRGLVSSLGLQSPGGEPLFLRGLSSTLCLPFPRRPGARA